MAIILHERQYAEHLLESSDMGAHPSDALTRIAKLCVADGRSNTETRQILEQHVIKCIPDANLTMWQDLIARCIRSAKRYPLIDIDWVPVYRGEMQICAGLDGVQTRRLMFTLICLARYGNMINDQNNNWVNRQESEILRLANLEVSVMRRSLMLNGLREAGLVGFSRRVDNLNINVRCLSDEKTDVEILRVTDFRNLGYQFMRYAGAPSLECSMCGAVIPKKNNRQLYCKDCAKEVNREHAASRYRRHSVSI